VAFIKLLDLLDFRMSWGQLLQQLSKSTPEYIARMLLLRIIAITIEVGYSNVGSTRLLLNLDKVFNNGRSAYLVTAFNEMYVNMLLPHPTKR